MRNLKRALSLALASVMLLGMMVVGTSAAFADADEIVNTEAVEITAGLGLFAGSDGKFNPKGNVTRAQMATVIVKMLYGSEINADQYKGVDKFSDVAAFEGGWAEGYINLCANLGVVGGYGDGTFKPGNSVTTAEAVTMIINALKVDAGAGTWPLTVMAKAEEMKLFEELAVKPGTNNALTRDELASIVLEGLKYSPSDKSGYTVPGNRNIIFDDLGDAVIANGNSIVGIEEVVGEDTLAKTVFDLTAATGFVTGNQATGLDYTAAAGVAVALETGLDMIGHYVTVYYAEEYQSEDEPGKAYCVVDEAKYVTVDEPQVDTKKEYQKFFGTKAITPVANVEYTDGNYNVMTFPYTVDENDPVTPENAEDDTVYTFAGVAGYNANTWTAGKGTYAIYEGEIIAFISNPASYVTKVQKVTTTAGKESITLADGGQLSNAEDDDVVVEYDGIAKNDIVVVNVAQGSIYTLTKATAVEGQVTKTSTNEYGEATLTINGTTYVAYPGAFNTSGLNRNTIDFDKNYEIYTIGGKYIGWKAATSEANVSDVIYVLGSYAVDTTDAYGNVVTNVYAQGVDMTGKEVSVLIGIDYEVNTEAVVDLGVCAEDGYNAETYAMSAGYVTFKLSTDKDAKKANIMVATALNTSSSEDYEDGLYTATVSSGTEMKSDDGKITTSEGLAYIADTTKIILVEGGLGETLETAVMTGSIKKTLGDNVDVILTQDDYGSKTMEVMVIVDVVGLQAEDYIFVSDVDAAAAATVGAGLIEVEAWFTKSGEKKTVVISSGAIDGDGFYEYTYDAVEETYELTDADTEGTGLLVNETFENANIAKGLLVSSNIPAYDASAAKIIDTRSEKELEESDVAEITSLEDMADATLGEYVVKFIAIVDDEDEIVENVFIISVEEAQA